MTQNKNTTVHQGGLMRCCLATLGDFINEKPDQIIYEGDVLNCRYEKNQTEPKMVYHKGAWRWNRAEQ